MNDRETRAIRHLLHTNPTFLFQFAFRALHPEEEYQHNISIDLLGDALLKCYQGKTRRLIINMPPRSLKTTCTSIIFPAWILGVRPETKIMCLTGQQNMLDEQHERCLKLMSNPRYQSLFSHIRINKRSNQITTPHGGYRSKHLTLSSIAGPPADMIIIDDPQSAMDAKDPDKCAKLNEWYDRTIYHRLNNKHTGVVVVITQRLSEDDLTGHLLKQDGWEVLNLSAIAMADEFLPPKLGGGVARLKGEALHPERESCDQLRKTMLRIGATAFMARYQQAPYPRNEGDTYHGLFHIPPHPDASVEERKHTQELWFGNVPKTTFLLDQLFGIRTCIRHGGPPALSVAEWCAIDQSKPSQNKQLTPVKKNLVLPDDNLTQLPAPDHTKNSGIRCEPCTIQDIESMKRQSKQSWH